MRAFYKIWAFTEEHNSIIFLIIGAGIFWRSGHLTFKYLVENCYNYIALYEAIFGLSGVVFALLFAFYTYMISVDSHFINSSRNSEAFKKMIAYVKRAVFVSICVAIITLPMLVFEFAPTDRYTKEWLYTLVWTASVFAFAASFWRANALFWTFAKGAE